jgi:hypothetical protein
MFSFSQEILSALWNQSFISMFTLSYRLSLSWAGLIPSTSATNCFFKIQFNILPSTPVSVNGQPTFKFLDRFSVLILPYTCHLSTISSFLMWSFQKCLLWGTRHEADQCLVSSVLLLPLIHGDQKVFVHLMITIQKVTSNVQSVPRQSPNIYWH